MNQYHFAQLSDDQKRLIRQLEEELGLILIAYERERDQIENKLRVEAHELENRNYNTRQPYQENSNFKLL